jgi:Lon protease-like protein
VSNKSNGDGAAHGGSKAMPLPRPLPLFPLGTVLFPGALLGLKVFEPRYLDLMTRCLRTHEPFGVICLQQGREVGPAEVQMEAVGTLAHIEEADAEEPGILRLRCIGGRRFRRVGEPEQRGDGLWLTDAEELPEDPPRMPGPAVRATVEALAEAIRKLQAHDSVPFAPPWRLDEAGWVANRWCELLPLPLPARQKLMELDDPVIRLSLVDGYLRDKKVIVG